MKQIFIKISSFALAFLVLFSTFSFTVEKHYCGDFLVDVSFTGETEGCLMEMEKASQFTKKKCCKDVVQKFEGQDELQLSNFDKISFEKQQFLAAFILSYKDFFSEYQTVRVALKDFPSPEIHQNYQVIYQLFLI
jgi:hypothetical protein